MGPSVAGMSDPQVIQIFISSPVDVGPERAIAERVISRLDGIWKAHVGLRAKRWEKAHYQAIKGFQEAIGEMAAYDLVLGILWKRIGSPLPPDLFQRQDGTSYESGTVFEIETALAAGKGGGKPAVYILRKSEAVKFDAKTVDEEKLQHDRLTNWWNRTFRDKEGHYRRGFQEYEGLEDFERELEQLVEGYLRERNLIPVGPAWDIELKGSPYPGLVRYGLEYAAVYCGRGLAVTGALEDLKLACDREMPALFIVGPSGSGKSSMANAGLAPQFSGRNVNGIDFWRHLVVEPADDVLLLIATQLVAVLPELAAGPHRDIASFRDLAASAPDAAAQSVAWALERAGEALRIQTGGGKKQVGRVLLILDQLETILRSAQARQVSALAKALIANEAAFVIATLRSDCYADLQENADFMNMRQRGVLLDLPLPGPSEIDDIIKGPARAANLIFEERNGESLANVVKAAAGGPDALPLLQMTLKRLFDARDGGKLSYAAYESMGGLEGAIAAHASEIFRSISPPARSKLDGLLRALVADIDEDGRLTICTPARSTLATDPASAELVDKMTEARLLVSAGDSIRIAHEALLRRWQAAVDSPALQPSAIRLRRQIQPNFDLWTQTGLDSDLLQAGTALAAAERVTREHPGAFPPKLDAYIERSAKKASEWAARERLKAEAEARSAKLRASIAFAMVAVLAVISVIAFRLYESANDNFVLALLAKADQLLVEDRPTRARFVAESIPGDWFSRALVATGVWTESQASVRTRTIAQIAGPAAAAPAFTLMGRSGASALSVSADGKTFAAGFSDGAVIVGSLDADARLTQLAGHSAQVRAMQFSPKEGLLVSASTDHSVRIWNLATGNVETICVPSLVDGIDINRQGDVALASEDGKVSLFNLAAPDIVKVFSLDHGEAYSVAFNNDGSVLASSGSGDSIFVRRLSDGSLVNKITTEHSVIYSIAFSPDAKHIVSASVSGPVAVWDAYSSPSSSTGIPIDIPPEKRWKARFSPDGRLLSVASWDGTVRLFDGRTYRYVATIDGNDHWINDAIFAAGSARLITAGQSGAVRIWDISDARSMFLTVKDDEKETLRGRYSPDGTKFASGGLSGVARLYGVDQSGQFDLICSMRHEGEITSIAFSPDSSRIISVGDRDGVADNVVKLWNATDCSSVRDFPVGADQVYAVAYSPSGEHIAWAHRSGRIELTKLDGEWQSTSLPNLHHDAVIKLDFSPDGKLLASAGGDRRVILWDVAQRQMSGELGGAHQQRVTTVKFSPDGRLVASGGPEDHVFIWDLTKPGPPIKSLDVAGGSNELAFNADGSVLAVGSDARFIAEWSVPSWKKIFQLNALDGVRSVFGFHPKRGDLAFDGENGLIRILPNSADAYAPPKIAASLDGLDVHFDRLPAIADLPVAIRSTGPTCSASSSSGSN
jgi:WD40 repeat protein